MKALILFYILFGLCGVRNALGALDSVDWRLKAFDEANALSANMENKQRDFIVGKEPALKAYIDNLLTPWETATEHLRRAVFVKKIQVAPETIDLKASPWVWALDTPFDDLKKWIGDGKDDSVRLAYEDFKRKSDALHAAEKMMTVLNKVYKENRKELIAMEERLDDELIALEKTVKEKQQSVSTALPKSPSPKSGNQ
ncbi:MAG: hypothetical protein ABSE59_11605 [Opitutaceae bacterium]|jgi:hypothetical protein